MQKIFCSESALRGKESQWMCYYLTKNSVREETWRIGKKANTWKIHSFPSFFSLSIILFITDWQCARHWAGQAGNSSKQSLWNPAFVSPWKWKWKPLSPVWLFATPRTLVHGILQASLLEWVAFPFSRGSSQPRDRTQVSCTAGGFFTSQATREAQESQVLQCPVLTGQLSTLREKEAGAGTLLTDIVPKVKPTVFES